MVPPVGVHTSQDEKVHQYYPDRDTEHRPDCDVSVCDWSLFVATGFV